jgi:hypothetical protein
VPGVEEKFLETANGKTAQHPRSFCNHVRDIGKLFVLNFEKGVEAQKS